ncbi:hypothetical protein N9248_02710, partial [bacterium]|nr:hypothetical protein [bacterium]
IKDATNLLFPAYELGKNRAFPCQPIASVGKPPTINGFGSDFYLAENQLIENPMRGPLKPPPVLLIRIRMRCIPSVVVANHQPAIC